MKRERFTLLPALCFALLAAGCSDLKFGDEFLDKAPDSDITIDEIFSSRMYAERALVSAYATLRTGLTLYPNDGSAGYEYQDAGNKLGWDNLDALTDIMNSYCNWGGVYGSYYAGNYDAASENASTWTKYSFHPMMDGSWRGIRKAYIYINNVDRVPDMTPEEKIIRKGEARMIIACQFHELMRHFGGVPLLYSNIEAENDIGNDYSRQTLRETIDFIVGLCDQAARELPWTVGAADDGRFTAASALGLKIRVLLIAASPLFNASQPYLEMGEPTRANADKLDKADIPLMTWLGDYSHNRWQQVVDACEDFFRENAANGNPYRLVQPETDDAEGYRSAFSGCYADRNNGEILISTCRSMRTFGDLYHRMYFGPSADINGNTGRGYGGGCITLNYVDLFPAADGEPAPYAEWLRTNGQSGTLANNPFTGRDPRLYEAVMIVGDRFQGRVAEMWVGGRERGSLDSPRAISGFCSRKYIWDYNEATFHNRQANYAYLRMAEIHLAYAEALNETGQKALAFEQLNMVRNRVGLPDMDDALLARVQGGREHPSYPECSLTGDAALREEILDERAREMSFEEVRWFDIARWKRSDIFRKSLQGITVTIEGGSVEGGDLVLRFSEPQPIVDRYWKNNFSPKWYLSALPPNEINKGYGLIQNPGW